MTVTTTESKGLKMRSVVHLFREQPFEYRKRVIDHLKIEAQDIEPFYFKARRAVAKFRAEKVLERQKQEDQQVSFIRRQNQMHLSIERVEKAPCFTTRPAIKLEPWSVVHLFREQPFEYRKRVIGQLIEAQAIKFEPWWSGSDFEEELKPWFSTCDDEQLKEVQQEFEPEEHKTDPYLIVYQPTPEPFDFEAYNGTKIIKKLKF